MSFCAQLSGQRLMSCDRQYTATPVLEATTTCLISLGPSTVFLNLRTNELQRDLAPRRERERERDVHPVQNFSHIPLSETQDTRRKQQHNNVNIIPYSQTDELKNNTSFLLYVRLLGVLILSQLRLISRTLFHLLITHV